MLRYVKSIILLWKFLIKGAYAFYIFYEYSIHPVTVTWINEDIDMPYLDVVL